MSKRSRTVQIDIDDTLLPAAEKAVTDGECASFDDLVSAAVAEFLEVRVEYDQAGLDQRYEEIRTEIDRRRATATSESLSPEEVEKAIDEAMDGFDLPEHG